VLHQIHIQIYHTNADFWLSASPPPGISPFVTLTLIGGQGSDVFIEINRECKYVTQQLKYTFNEPWVASLVQLGTDFIAWAINMT
jgi:hypothetical protein